MDSPTLLPVLGICQGRMIVTETTTYGPLSKVIIKNTVQKVEISRKVADAIMGLHDVDVEVGKKGVVHRDIRAANILIDKGEGEKLEPKITGFDMCKRDNTGTGDYPEIEEQYRKWWGPERIPSSTQPKSDVYSFGVLMYEISTGREPQDGDLVEMESEQISAEYTALMKRCLNGRHLSASPTMDEVAHELHSIENALIGVNRKT